jgi:hypothetical protein
MSILWNIGVGSRSSLDLVHVRQPECDYGPLA